jgi:hypothetical protein
VHAPSVRPPVPQYFFAGYKLWSECSEVTLLRHLRITVVMHIRAVLPDGTGGLGWGPSGLALHPFSSLEVWKSVDVCLAHKEGEKGLGVAAVGATMLRTSSH